VGEGGLQISQGARAPGGGTLRLLLHLSEVVREPARRAGRQEPRCQPGRPWEGARHSMGTMHETASRRSLCH
jgi:hypothetical protein